MALSARPTRLSHLEPGRLHLSIGYLDLGVKRAPMQAVLFKTVKSMQQTLQSLTIQPPEMHRGIDNTPIVSLTFSDLRSLELHGFENPDVAITMQFWLRLTNLERIMLWKCAGPGPRFDQEAVSGLLPKLTRFKVRPKLWVVNH